ncbi:MAG TPA: ornithine cyclodeaminase family protein [Candidatus Acidoferrum sp.]|nr:ornithine cyclodeaminase family protein [Candidatus Acidoferrum sp.]
MNPLYLTEEDVVATLTVRDALRLVEDAGRAQADGKAENKPRQRVRTGGAVLQVLPAAYGERLGHKSYLVPPKPRGPRFLYLLFAASGELLALFEADALGQIRTGAVAGLATRVLAREDARTLGVIGSGWQAHTQVEAVCAVRPIERVRVYARNAERLRAFCEEMTAKIGIPVEPAGSAREAVSGAGVVSTITNSSTPVLEGGWLDAGAHVNAAGSNRANAQEIDVETVARASVVAVEDLAQAQVESGDLISAIESGRWSWDRAVLLSDLVAGKKPGRTSSDQITLFESLGIGLWDLAAASHVYDACVAAGRGSRLPIPG